MISVLMSVYKKENPTFLKASLDSIYAQTLRPDEIVLVEDGEISPALEEVISQYSDLHVVKLEKNLQPNHLDLDPPFELHLLGSHRNLQHPPL